MLNLAMKMEFNSSTVKQILMHAVVQAWWNFTEKLYVALWPYRN